MDSGSSGSAKRIRKPASAAGSKSVPAQPTVEAERTCILVLGMHRSGTSMVSRILNLAGASLPANLLGSAEGNSSGHWESARLVAFHDGLLARAGSRWDDWRALESSRLSGVQRAEAKQGIRDVIQDEYGESPLYLVKDPRICRFVDTFVEALEERGDAVKIVIPIRNPLEVCESLERREVIWPKERSRADAALLWLRHVLDAEYSTRGRPRVLVTRQDMMENWRAPVSQIVSAFGVEWPYGVDEFGPDVDAFVDPSRNHHTHTNEEVMLAPGLRTWVGEVWQALLVLTRSPRSQAATKVLDRVRAEFNGAVPILVQMGEHAQQLARQGVERASGQSQKIEQFSAELAKKQQEEARLAGALQQVTAELTEARAMLGAGVDAAAGQSKEIERLTGRLAQKEAGEAQLAASLELVRAELAETRKILIENDKVTSGQVAEIARLTSSVAQKEGEAGQLAATLEQRNAELAEARQVLTESDERSSVQVAEIARLTSSVAQKEGEAGQLAATLEQRNAELAESKLALSILKDREAVLMASLEELSAHIVALEDKLQDERARQAKMVAAMTRQQEEIEKRHVAEAAVTAAELSRLTELAERYLVDSAAFEELKNQFVLTSRRADHVSAELELAQQARRSIQASTSWRITAPIRNLKGVLQQIKAKLGFHARRTLGRGGAAVRRLRQMRPAHTTGAALSLPNAELPESKPIGHFDPVYYLKTYPDVAAAGLDPAEHFRNFGKAEGRWPNQLAAEQHERKRNAALSHKTRGTLVFVTHDTNVGGAPFVLKTLADWFHRRTQFDTRVISMADGALEHEFERSMPFLNIERETRESGEAKTRERLARFVGDNVKCIVVNSIASHEVFDHLERLNLPDAKIVCYLHELSEIIKSYNGAIERIKQCADIIVVGSDRVRSVLISEFGVPEHQCRLIYDFVEEVDAEPAQTQMLRAEKRAEFGVPDGATVVMGCGTIHWRKWPEKFIEAAAEAVRMAPSRSWKFLWIGGGEDQAKCEALARELGVDEIVEFLGYRPDVAADLAAADVFVLPSMEDPFPLVCVYAGLHSVPVVCFEGAGGMPEFTRKGCGRAVPFGDAVAIAEALLHYAADEAERRRDGERAREVALGRHTVAKAGPEFLGLIRTLCNLRPHVSVVVPNFNYARFLDQRLGSVFGQTYQDFEVILLDDCSTDESVALLQSYVDTHPSTQLHVNTENSGSPFAQWIKGMALARGELVWIAEADDYCEPNLLDSLLPSMSDRNVLFGYVKSVPVGKAGEILGDYEPLYLNRINEGRWSQSYTESDFEEIHQGLGIGNCIPNASSIVFRNFTPEPEFVSAVTKMKMCGDWFFYVRAIKGGLVTYVADTLNYHRRHDGTVTHRMEGSRRYFDELADTRRLISDTYALPESMCVKANAFTEEDIARFGIDDPKVAERVLEDARYRGRPKRIPTLLSVVSDLSPGGGQMFSIRLANAWAARGGRAVLLNAEYSATHDQVLAKIDPRVTLWSAQTPDFSLQALVEKFDIDVIHSSIWWADKLVHENIGQLAKPLPWFVSMHGCYETLLQNPDIDRLFPTYFAEMKQRVSHWIYTAEKNRAVFDAMGWPRNVGKILNGYQPEAPQPLSRDQLCLRRDSLVVCLASRAIESKGWTEAVEAVSVLNRAGSKIDLMLIGEGPMADQFKKANLPDFVSLHGQVANLQDYIAMSDVGLLPSSFVGESLPLVVIEMLAQGKPVIASSIGEIPVMLRGEQGVAGVLMELVGGKVLVSDIIAALTSMSDESLRMASRRIASGQFERYFQMSRMIEEYDELYQLYLSGGLGHKLINGIPIYHEA